MRSERFLQNPYYVEYVRLLVQLHDLIATGKGDDEEADTIRDQMDGPWRNLNEHEIARLRDLSADLYTIGEVRHTEGAVPDDVVQEFKQVSDWSEGIRLLRCHQDVVSPAEAAAFRGMAWARLGHAEIAMRFFDEALRLAPKEVLYEMLRLTCLTESGRISDAVQIAEAMTQGQSDAARMLKAAQVYFVWALTLSGTQADSAHRRAIEIAERGIALAKQSPEDKLVTQLAVECHIHRSLSYQQLGDATRARSAYCDALALDPMNPTVRLLGDYLEEDNGHQTTNGESTRTFHCEISQRFAGFPIPSNGSGVNWPTDLTLCHMLPCSLA